MQAATRDSVAPKVFGRARAMAEDAAVRAADTANDLGAKVRAWWPVLAGLVLVVLWLGGRLQSREEKLAQIRTEVKPVQTQVEAIAKAVGVQMTAFQKAIDRLDAAQQAHLAVDGHRVALTRINILEGRLAGMERKLDRILEAVGAHDPGP